MNKRPSLPPTYRLVLVILLLTMLFQFVPSGSSGTVQPAEAYDFVGAVSDLIPFGGIFKAMKVRNKVYKEANAFIDDQKDYYDRLQDNARERLSNRQFAGQNRSQVGAYVKVSVLIAQERKANLDFAELKKKAARKEFLDKFEKAILFRVINSGGAQKLIRAMSNGIRAAQGRLDSVLDQLAGDEGGFLGEIVQVRRQASRMHALAGAIGGRIGRGIGRTMGKLIEKIDSATGTFSGPIAEVNSQLGDLADMVESLDKKNLVPRGAEHPKDFVVRLVDGSQEDPVLDAILGIFDQNSGPRDSSIREQARQKILTGFIIRCARTGSKFQETLAKLENDAGIDENEERELSLCQSLVELLDQGEEDQNAAEEQGEDGADEPAAEPAANSLKLISVETYDGWCFPPIELIENEICNYDIDWEVEYSLTSGSALLICENPEVGATKLIQYFAQVVNAPSGTWEHTTDFGGFYPELGNYPEKFYCELRVPDLDGEVVARVDAEIIAPLTTLRED